MCSIRYVDVLHNVLGSSQCRIDQLKSAFGLMRDTASHEDYRKINNEHKRYVT